MDSKFGTILIHILLKKKLFKKYWLTILSVRPVGHTKLTPSQQFSHVSLMGIKPTMVRYFESED